MDIENGTNGDAKVKVSGSGPSGIPKGPPKEVIFKLGPGQVWTEKNLKPSSLPGYPWTVHFSVEVEVSRTQIKSNTDAKRLTLTKASNNGYKVKKA